jgi:hypothetical protein
MEVNVASRACRQRLTHRGRDVPAMCGRFLNELPAAEIARILGISNPVTTILRAMTSRRRTVVSSCRRAS